MSCFLALNRSKESLLLCSITDTQVLEFANTGDSFKTGVMLPIFGVFMVNSIAIKLLWWGLICQVRGWRLFPFYPIIPLPFKLQWVMETKANDVVLCWYHQLMNKASLLQAISKICLIHRSSCTVWTHFGLLWRSAISYMELANWHWAPSSGGTLHIQIATIYCT